LIWIKKGRLKKETLNPQKFGIRRAAPRSLSAGTPAVNKRLALAILKGREKGPLRDLVLLNAAAGLIAAGKCKGMRAGLIKAAHSIDSGRALRALEGLRRTSRNL